MKRGRRKNTTKEDANKALRIFDGDELLSLVEAKEIIDRIEDEHIKYLSIGRPAGLSGRCKHDYYVGEGTCLAKRFGKYGVREEQECKSCKHSEILDQLNCVFDRYFDNQYRAEWVPKRKYQKGKSVKNGG